MGALFGEKAFGAAHAGIRFERDFAEKLENSYAFAAAEVIPDGIRGQGCEHRVKQRDEKIQVTGSRERSGSQEQWHGREGQADLLGENPREQERMSMMEKKFDGAVHDWAAAVSGYFERKGAVCPHWLDITNSLRGLRVLGATSRSFKDCGKDSGSPG